MGVPLEPSREEFEAMAAAAVALVADFVDGRASAPAFSPEVDPALLARCASPPPEGGRPLADLLALVGEAAEVGIDTAGPGYVGFIPGGGLVAAAIADFLACAVNRFTNLAAPAPALVAVEDSVLRWLCGLFGLPAGARGVLTSGGSMANLSAVVAARHTRLGEDLAGAALYVSDQAHQSVAKAARIAGLPAAAVRVVASDRDLRLRAGAVEAAVEADRAAGRRPFLVVGSAGTTNTGAVDDLAGLAGVAARQGLWFHADAAYGGFFVLTERGRAALAGIGSADSITLDPHKSLFLPYGTGCLLARDGEALRAAHSTAGAYLQDLATGLDLPDFAAYSPELSRDFRGLRVWLPLHLHGVGAFRAALDEKLDLAARAHARLAAHPALEVPWVPALSTVAFRHRAGDPAGRAVMEAVNASGRAFLSSTVVGGRLTLRLCVLSHRTHADRLDEAVDLLLAATAREAS